MSLEPGTRPNEDAEEVTEELERRLREGHYSSAVIRHAIEGALKEEKNLREGEEKQQ